MPLQSVSRTALLAIAGAYAALACGDERPAPPGGDEPCADCPSAGAGGASSGGAGGSSSGGAGGSSSGGAGGSSSTGGAPPQGGSSGTAGNAGASGAAGNDTIPECGNGILEDGEACDGDDFGDLTCASYGFSEGELSCQECAASASACSGVELCSDGADNDGDGNADCDDGDCAEECVDFCANPTPLPNAVFITGKVDGQLAPNPSTCAPGSETGQLVFAYAPPLSGVADLFLDAPSDGLALSVRTSCAENASELSCLPPAASALERRLTAAVTQGEVVYVVVESPNRDAPEDFSLIASAREVVCGDGYADLDEECDDGNFTDTDGCSNACVFQPDETEPNDSLETANAYTPPEFFGAVSDVNDADVLSIAVSAGQRLVVETFDLGDGACARYELDNAIDVLDGAGDAIDSDDDGGTGFCAALISEPLGAGTHYVRVRASGTAESFFYRLRIRLED